MMLELESGEIISPEKDCGCITHDGPHWVHMDTLDKRMNRELLDKRVYQAFALQESHRLQRKLHEMTTRRVARVIE